MSLDPHAADIADLKARVKSIEDQKPIERLGKLERFQTGITYGIALLSAGLGFMADFLKRKLGV